MKHIIYIAMIVTLLVLLSACESGGKLKIYNQTSFPAYASIQGEDTVTIASGGEHVFDVDTETQSFLTGEVKKNVKVFAQGETYAIYDDTEEEYYDSTYVSISAGKTTNVYLNPNRASIKIINNRSASVAYAEIWQYKALTQVRVATLQNIPSGSSRYQRVDYATPTNSFYYKVLIMMENGDLLSYGDSNNILGNDQQFVVTINPPAK